MVGTYIYIYLLKFDRQIYTYYMHARCEEYTHPEDIVVIVYQFRVQRTEVYTPRAFYCDGGECENSLAWRVVRYFINVIYICIRIYSQIKSAHRLR